MEPESIYVPVPNKFIKRLCKGDYVQYLKKGDDVPKKGVVLLHWSKEGEGGNTIKGLRLAFNLSKDAPTWTITYDSIHTIEKKIRNEFYFEWYYVMTRLERLEDRVENS